MVTIPMANELDPCPGVHNEQYAVTTKTKQHTADIGTDNGIKYAITVNMINNVKAMHPYIAAKAIAIPDVIVGILSWTGFVA